MPMRRLDQRSDRANKRALTARNAIGLTQGLIKNGDRTTFLTAIGEPDHIQLLPRFAARLCAQTALNAFGQVSPDARRGMVGQVRVMRVRRPASGCRPMGLPFMLAHQALELATTIHLAMQAIIGMARHQPFSVGLAERAQGVRFCFDAVSVCDHGDAGWLWLGIAVDLHKAHAADRMGGQTRIAAERRN